MNKRGFTLVELLIVIAILGILAAITIPNVQKCLEKRKAAKSAQVDKKAPAKNAEPARSLGR